MLITNSFQLLWLTIYLDTNVMILPPQIPSEAIPLLIGVIQAADSRAKESVNATENCISAVGKVMRYRPECVNVDEILPHWISWLPLNEDKEEAVHTFNYLCDLIER